MEALFGGIQYTQISMVDFWKQLKKSALMLVLRAMKSTPTEALESELNIVPIDLRLEDCNEWKQ